VGSALVTAGERERTTRRRRAGFFLLVVLTAGFATALMVDIVMANGLTPIEALGLLPFFVLIAWLAAAFWTAIAGFAVRIRGGDRAALSADPMPALPLKGRTALLLCIHEEQVERVSAGIAAIWASLGREPEADAFDLWVLSDSQDAEVAREEEHAFRVWSAWPRAGGRIHYRRRSDRSGRKAGNVADFVRRWGGAYESMIVLDADSVMSGEAIVALARLMDLHPDVGIIQTLPMPVGGETLFARIVQFSARIQSPMLASGLCAWQLAESNYWGHNAILRVRAFARHCGLPKLSGDPPFGGEILSHDFVEAACMRRAGLRVWLVPELGGSWERIPTNVLDYATRDQRWVQGNLQHLRVLSAGGLHWMSRVHMLTGVMSYVSSLLWLVVLVLASAAACIEAARGPVYFEHGAHSLFPTWPESRAIEVASLLACTAVLLLLPKALGALLAFRDRRLLAGFGGRLRLALGLVLEQVFSIVLAPTMMLFHSAFVVRIASGRSVGWGAQARGDRAVSWGEAWRRHRWQLAVGIVWGAIVSTLAPRFTVWLAPVLVGLFAAIPLTVATSRATLGRRWRGLGLLGTPEESFPPIELQAALAATSGLPIVGRAAAGTPSVPPFARLAMEPAVLGADPRRRPLRQTGAVVGGRP